MVRKQAVAPNSWENHYTTKRSEKPDKKAASVEDAAVESMLGDQAQTNQMKR